MYASCFVYPQCFGGPMHFCKALSWKSIWIKSSAKWMNVNHDFVLSKGICMNQISTSYLQHVPENYCMYNNLRGYFLLCWIYKDSCIYSYFQSAQTVFEKHVIIITLQSQTTTADSSRIQIVTEMMHYVENNERLYLKTCSWKCERAGSALNCDITCFLVYKMLPGFIAVLWWVKKHKVLLE